jgi:hypothetical protein
MRSQETICGGKMLKEEIIKVADFVAKEILDRNIETEKDYHRQHKDIIDKALEVLFKP